MRPPLARAVLAAMSLGAGCMRVGFLDDSGLGATEDSGAAFGDGTGASGDAAGGADPAGDTAAALDDAATPGDGLGGGDTTSVGDPLGPGDNLAAGDLLVAGDEAASGDAAPAGDELLSGDTAPATFIVWVLVTGLNDTGLVLQNNLGDDLAIPAAGLYAFAIPQLDQGSYAVSILSDAVGNACDIPAPSGTIAGADVTIDVACAPLFYSVGGSFLDRGVTMPNMVLRNNGGDDLAVSVAAPNYAFSVAHRSTYAITVGDPPDYPLDCALIGSGTGMVDAADVLDLDISCRSVRDDDFAGTTLGVIWNPLDTDAHGISDITGATWDPFFTVANNQLSITGYGYDFWGTDYEFVTVYRTDFPSDFDISIKLVSITDDITDWTKAGFVVANDMLDNNFCPGGGLVTWHVIGDYIVHDFGFNEVDTNCGNGLRDHAYFDCGPTIRPAWLRLRKLGTTFHAYYKFAAGDPWTPHPNRPNTTIAGTNANSWIGLWVVSKKPSTEGPATAVFEDFTDLAAVP